MIALVVLDEVLLAIEYAIAAIHDTWPVLSSLVHPHLMFLPIRLGLEGLLRFLFCAIGTEHVWLTALALGLVIGEQGRRGHFVRRGITWFYFEVDRAVHVRRRCEDCRNRASWVQASRVRTRLGAPHSRT